jgi:hypothetical protein
MFKIQTQKSVFPFSLWPNKGGEAVFLWIAFSKKGKGVDFFDP